jgi:NAD(P)-dependent dehydrogenase (short-subunit alcohol dehydrogenase family)
MSGRLVGKVCLVTGAASGIGRATAELMAAEGGQVVGVDLQSHDVGDIALVADVSDEAQVVQAYREAHESAGRLDVLFHNAGIATAGDGSALDTELSVWRRVIDVNLTSMFLCCKHGIPYLRERGGSVINTASVVALVGSATSQVAYTASKGGVLALSRELGVQFAAEGIRVNALCPGPVLTPLLEEVFSEAEDERQLRLVHAPAGRFGHVAEIAHAAVFLACEESSWINATAFAVDGGLSAAYVTAGQLRTNQ